MAYKVISGGETVATCPTLGQAMMMAQDLRKSGAEAKVVSDDD